jgi:hypothetical protein
MYSKLAEEEAELMSIVKKKRDILEIISKSKNSQEDENFIVGNLTSLKRHNQSFMRNQLLTIAKGKSFDKADTGIHLKDAISRNKTFSENKSTQKIKFSLPGEQRNDNKILIKNFIEEINKIFANLETQINPDADFSNIIKLLEIVFEKLLIKNKVIKEKFPNFYLKWKREYHMIEKKNPFMMKEYLQTVQRRDRMNKIMIQAKKAADSKQFRSLIPKIPQNYRLKINLVQAQEKEEEDDDERFFS